MPGSGPVVETTGFKVSRFRLLVGFWCCLVCLFWYGLLGFFIALGLIVAIQGNAPSHIEFQYAVLIAWPVVGWVTYGLGAPWQYSSVRPPGRVAFAISMMILTVADFFLVDELFASGIVQLFMAISPLRAFAQFADTYTVLFARIASILCSGGHLIPAVNILWPALWSDPDKNSVGSSPEAGNVTTAISSM